MTKLSWVATALGALLIASVTLFGMEESFNIQCSDGLLELPARTRLWFNANPGKRWVDTKELLNKASVLRHLQIDTNDENELLCVPLTRETVDRLYQYLRLVEVDREHATVPAESLSVYDDSALIDLAQSVDYLNVPRAKRFLAPSLVERISKNQQLRNRLLCTGKLGALEGLIDAYGSRIARYCKARIAQMLNHGLILEPRHVEIDHNGFTRISLNHSAQFLSLAVANSICVTEESDGSFLDEMGSVRHNAPITSLVATAWGELITGDESGRLISGPVDRLDQFKQMAAIQGRSIRSIVSHPGSQLVGVIADGAAYLLSQRAGDPIDTHYASHECKRITKHRNVVTGLAFDEQGSTIHISYQDGLIETHDVTTGVSISQLSTGVMQDQTPRLWGQVGPWLIISSGNQLKRKHIITGKRKTIKFEEPIIKVVTYGDKGLVAVMYGADRTKLDLISIPSWSWCMEFITNPQLIDMDIKNECLAVLFSNGIPKVYSLSCVVALASAINGKTDPIELTALYSALKNQVKGLDDYLYLKQLCNTCPSRLRERLRHYLNQEDIGTRINKPFKDVMGRLRKLLIPPL